MLPERKRREKDLASKLTVADWELMYAVARRRGPLIGLAGAMACALTGWWLPVVRVRMLATALSFLLAIGVALPLWIRRDLRRARARGTTTADTPPE